MSASLDDLAIDHIVCHRCGATYGVPCRTKSGRRATSTHTDRMHPVMEVWREGYGEGGRDAVRAADDFLRRRLPDSLDTDILLAQMSAWVGRFLP